VKDYLIFGLGVVDFGVFRSGTRSLCVHALSRFLNAPGVLSEIVSLLSRKLRLSCVQLNCNVESKASNVNLVVGERYVLALCHIFNVIK